MARAQRPPRAALTHRGATRAGENVLLRAKLKDVNGRTLALVRALHAAALPPSRPGRRAPARARERGAQLKTLCSRVLVLSQETPKSSRSALSAEAERVLCVQFAIRCAAMRAAAPRVRAALGRTC